MTVHKNLYEKYLYASDVFTRLSIDPNDITHFHKLGAVHFEARLRLDLLRHAGGSIPTDGGFCFQFGLR